MPKGDLTPKQAAFVQEYLCDLNGTQAAIRAGYSPRTANEQAARLLAKASVSDAIAAAQRARSQRVEITADYVLSNLTEVVERCMERAPVLVRRGRQVVQMTDDEGRDVWQFDARGANQALNLLGQHMGLFTKKVEHSGDLRVGGVLRLAEPMKPEDWSATAQAQQEHLEAKKRALAEAHGVG